MPSDAELLRAWGSGDQRAGRELFDRHYPSIYRFFRNKVDGSVDDLVQDTLAACVAGIDRFRGEGSFRAFLFGTARHVLWRHYRTKRRDEVVDFSDRSVVDFGAGPSTLAAKQSEQRLLLEALRRLPLETQVLLELYMWEDLSGPELAEALDLSLAAIRSRLHRGKQRLRELLEEVAESLTVLESTMTSLDTWARGIRELAGPNAG